MTKPNESDERVHISEEHMKAIKTTLKDIKSKELEMERLQSGLPRDLAAMREVEKENNRLFEEELQGLIQKALGELDWSSEQALEEAGEFSTDLISLAADANLSLAGVMIYYVGVVHKMLHEASKLPQLQLMDLEDLLVDAKGAVDGVLKAD